MTEKLKYRVGDKVLVEAKVEEADSYDTYPCRLRIGNTTTGWVKADEFKKSLVNLPPKPKVPQAVMDWCETKRAAGMIWKLAEWFDSEDMPVEVSDWLFTGADLLLKQHALATLIAYGPEAVEVEKEKRYRVRIKDNLVVGDTLTKNPTSLMFTFSIRDGSDNEIFTKNELEDWGFGAAFDNPMFEVEEVGDEYPKR